MNRYLELLAKAGPNANTPEYKSLFWIISQNQMLYKRLPKIYDFENHNIISECLLEESFSSSEKAMLRLAFNLFNGLMSHNNDVSDIFAVLDKQNFEICIEALRIRFNQSSTIYLDQ